MAATPAMLHSIDKEGRLVAVSDAWLAKLGYQNDEVIGRPLADFVIFRSKQSSAKERSAASSCENSSCQMLTKDGAVIDVLLSAKSLGEKVGDVDEILSVVTDITPVLESKRLLAESEAHYRSLVEDQSELVSLATPEGELRYVNRAYASFYGQKPEGMIGKNLLDLAPKEERSVIAEHLWLACEMMGSVSSENQVIVPGGGKRWLAWTNRALRDEAGRVSFIHSVGRDIQERVDAERRLKDSEARYRFIADNSGDMILLVDADGKRLYASPACYKLLGYSQKEMVSLRLQEMIHPEDASRVLPVLAGRPADTTFTYRMRRRDGAYVWVETTGKTVELADGDRQRLIIVRDIEQRVVAEQQLKESEARYRLLADNGTDMVFQLDRDLVRRYVSPACREILGYEPEEIIGQKPVNMSHPDDAPRVGLAFTSLLQGHLDRMAIVNRIRHKEGPWIWVEAELRTLRDSQTREPIGIIGALRDISRRKAIEDELAEANRRLHTLAGQDGLTGLANRRALDEGLSREFRRAKRDGAHLALIMIDVDHFKSYNDRYGHPAGDDCLRRVADTVFRSVKRPGDLVARYGGEEFAVVLAATNESDAYKIASRVRQAVVDLMISHEGNPRGVVTISAGVAATQPAVLAERPDHLLRDADRALYLAKGAGRNVVILASATKATSSSKPDAVA